MHNIINAATGVTIATTDGLAYIRMQDNGSYGLCYEQQAQGIAHNGAVYHLAGRDGMEDAETVALSEVDGGTLIREQHAIAALAFAGAASAGQIPDAQISQHADLFEEWRQTDWRDYKQGTIRAHGGALWRFVQPNLADESQNVEPGTNEAIWTEIAYRDGVRIIPDAYSSTTAFGKDELGYWHGSDAAVEGVYRSTYAGNTTHPGDERYWMCARLS